MNGDKIISVKEWYSKKLYLSEHYEEEEPECGQQRHIPKSAFAYLEVCRFGECEASAEVKETPEWMSGWLRSTGRSA